MLRLPALLAPGVLVALLFAGCDAGDPDERVDAPGQGSTAIDPAVVNPNRYLDSVETGPGRQPDQIPGGYAMVEPTSPADDGPVPRFRLHVTRDGCTVARSVRPPGAVVEGLSWTVRGQDGDVVFAAPAAGRVRYRYHRAGRAVVSLTAYDGRTEVRVSNTVAVDC